MHLSRRFLIILLAFLASASVVRPAAAALAYVIADAQTGYILEEQEPRKKLQVGSLTKIATASVVLDWSERKSGDLNQVVTIPQEAFVGTSENNIGFQPGDSITLRDLLYAALVQSDNIAAYTLAHHVGSQLGSLLPSDVGSKFTPVDAFVAQMNALAKQLKMERLRASRAAIELHASQHKRTLGQNGDRRSENGPFRARGPVSDSVRES